MTRSSAREIAIHCSYSLGFSHESADEFLAVRLNKENFQRWSQESALYKEYPNEKQLQYIKELVRGVANHGPELDQYIAQYAKDWSFARIPLPVPGQETGQSRGRTGYGTRRGGLSHGCGTGAGHQQLHHLRRLV